MLQRSKAFHAGRMKCSKDGLPSLPEARAASALQSRTRSHKRTRMLLPVTVKTREKLSVARKRNAPTGIPSPPIKDASTISMIASASSTKCSKNTGAWIS